jgi:signal transduction histidine kinase
MGFDARFTLGLVAWLGAILLALAACIAAWLTADLAAARLVAGLALAAAVAGLWWHISRTNRMVAQFFEALRHREFAARFDQRGGAGFDRLATALDAAMEDLQRERLAGERELRFFEALVDDTPVALLSIEAKRGIVPLNKAARRIFDRHSGTRPADFAIYGATFAERLANPDHTRRELLLLRLDDGLQRALFRIASLARLGAPAHIASVEPIQGTLDSVEVAAQTDLVRVLTHEILNSLTPVMSLSRTLQDLLAAPSPDLADAREAAETLTRRTQGLRNFVDAYRAVAQPPQPRPILFAASPLVLEMERLFRAEWPRCEFALAASESLELEADPDLLAQVLINLLRNAAQATDHLPTPIVRMRLRTERELAIIEVEDNGPGIAPALRSEIFLPFYTTRHGGSGIGLNLVRQIAVASGWSVEVDSGALGGALLRVLLPR